jgi:hypothetical protein
MSFEQISLSEVEPGTSFILPKDDGTGVTLTESFILLNHGRAKSGMDGHVDYLDGDPLVLPA